jgi:hypothetical protein
MRAATLVLMIVTTACGASTSPGESTLPSVQPSEALPSAAPSGPPSATLEDRLEAEIAITGADFPMVAFDAVWVVSAETEPAVVRVDPETNEVAAQIPVPGRGCNGMTAGFDSIWACASDGIARIDPASNTVVTVIDVDAVGQARLAAGGGSVWAFTRTSDEVVGADGVLRIDPGNNALAAAIGLGHPLGTMAFGFDALWVTSPEDGLLLRVDPATNEVTTAAEGLLGPFVVSIGPDAIWVSLHGTDGPSPQAGDPTIVRIDPATGNVVASIATDPVGRTGGIAVDDEAVWVRSAGAFLTHIDPVTNEVVEVITASKGGGDVVLGFGSVWTTSWNFHQMWRVSTGVP